MFKIFLLSVLLLGNYFTPQNNQSFNEVSHLKMLVNNGKFTTSVNYLSALKTPLLISYGWSVHKTVESDDSSDDDVFMGEVLVFYELDLKENYPNESFEKFIRTELIPIWKNQLPNTQLLLLKGDRGTRNGQYIVMMNFEKFELFHKLFPEDISDKSIETNENFQNLLPVWKRFKEFIKEKSEWKSYQIVGKNRMKKMLAIELLGLHQIKIKPGMEQDFESFIIQKWNFLEEVPGMWGIVLKRNRHDVENKYLWISAFDPGGMRDAYFPEPGVGSDAWRQAIFPIQKILDELDLFFEINPGTEGFYTDYFILK